MPVAMIGDRVFVTVWQPGQIGLEAACNAEVSCTCWTGGAASVRGRYGLLTRAFYCSQRFRCPQKPMVLSDLLDGFYIHVTVHRDRFLSNNQPDPLIIQILFCYKTLHVSGISFAHHQEFSTVHSGVVSFIQVLMTASKQSQDGISDSAWKRSSKPAWNLPVPNVKWKTPDDGQRRCPKHEGFYNRIKFE
jgi:hypothetical protein